MKKILSIISVGFLGLILGVMGVKAEGFNCGMDSFIYNDWNNESLTVKENHSLFEMNACSPSFKFNKDATAVYYSFPSIIEDNATQDYDGPITLTLNGNNKINVLDYYQQNKINVVGKDSLEVKKLSKHVEISSAQQDGYKLVGFLPKTSRGSRNGSINYIVEHELLHFFEYYNPNDYEDYYGVYFVVESLDEVRDNYDLMKAFMPSDIPDEYKEEDWQLFDIDKAIQDDIHIRELITYYNVTDEWVNKNITTNLDAKVVNGTLKISQPSADKANASIKDSKYTILNGENQTYKAGEDLVIRASGELEKFVKLLIDDKEVAKENYELSSGSTIVKLKSSYLKTLASGNHTVKFVYTDGEATTEFKVDKKSSNPKTTDMIRNTLVITVLGFVGLNLLVLIKKKGLI